MNDTYGQSAQGRREFLRAAGLGGVTLAVGGVLAACSDTSSSALEPRGASLAVVEGNNVTLDFRSDIDVLNYAYALEQLEAAFYTQVVANAAFTTIFPREEQIVLRDLRDHEIAHREFFRAALGTNAIPDLSVNFSTIPMNNRSAVLNAVAGKIVSVEARHASAVRAIRNGNYTTEFAPNAFDPALAPDRVIAAARSFVVQNIIVVNA
jgi:hypothetical protein